MNFSEKKYETDASSIEIQIPELKNFKNTDFEEKFNSSYRDTVNNLINTFNSQIPENSPEKSIFRLGQQVTYNTEPFISIVSDLYVFTEGIHGTSDRIVKNIDYVNALEIKLSDLFSDAGYEEMINREINKILESNKEEYSDLWEKPILNSSHQDNFYFSESGIVIFYPPYELSYYARGFIDFTIPFEEAVRYMKDEYRKYFI